MKQKYIYRNRLAMLLLLISCLTVARGQGDSFIASSTNGYYFNPQNIGLSTPQVADFMTYGNVDVNHYNGLLNLAIDLDGYKDQDFDLPMSIKYVSSGFSPFKRPSVVGYNWFLNFGGAITRTVKGSPDDTKGNYENNANRYLKNGLLVAVRNGTFGNYSEQDLTGFQMPRTSNSSVPHLWGDFKYDFEPDIFNFSFGQHSGSFIIGHNGNPVSLSGNGYNIDTSGLTIQEYSTTAVPQSSTIKITTPDGFIYEFGGNTNYLEYSIPNNPTKVIQKPRQILSWHLKSIQAPNGRTVEFIYTSKLLPNSYTYLLYLRFQMGIAFVDPNIPSSMTDHESAEQKTMQDDVYTPIISKVVIDNDTEIRFQSITGPAFHGSSPSVYYSNISLYHGTTNIKESRFTYLTKGKYTFLNKLIKNDKEYSFDYNMPEAMPDPLTTSLDHWGFWNGGTNTTITDVKDYCLNAEVNKNTSGRHFNTGLLSKITYPTKGYTSIVYEQNKYDKYVECNLEQEKLDLLSTPASVLCGGSRVKQINDYDPTRSQISNSRTFQYTIPNTSKGSGIIGHKPKYKFAEFTEAHVVGGNSYSQVTNIVTVSTNSMGYNENLPEYHIGYSHVTEHFSDRSYIQYQYTSHMDNPNVMEGTTYSILMSPTARDLKVREKHGMYLSNDLSEYRGKLSEKKCYSSAGILKQTERYIYNTTDAKKSYTTAVASTSKGPASYRIYSTPCLLNKKEVIDENGVQYTENYQYNAWSIISERKTINSDGKEIVVQYTYPTDYTYSYLGAGEKRLFDKNILAKPITIKKLTCINSTTNKTLESLLLTYKIENNLPVLANVKQLVGSTWKTLIEYPRYDSYGNPQHTIENGLLQTVYIWGYKGQCIVAQMVNAWYDDVQTKAQSAGLNLSELTNSSTLSDSHLTKLNALRVAIPQAQITTYNYKPLVGIISVIDASGKSTNYDYDSFNRLKETSIDKGGVKEILESYKYNYAN